MKRTSRDFHAETGPPSQGLEGHFSAVAGGLVTETSRSEDEEEKPNTLLECPTSTTVL